ncbi:non-hydrolyzing UDP-N-acetylglucosamine 2-epimerase [Lactococcus nasutitermitis]|uniref:UDP-N-acetylglucosamine 2-epimerase (non-hydrolyzing) n=1 Tax=Lactococcus nasutitermitis TaxID=1652957 RepID=A0ABV9JBW8_9LACT|nr:UDP-N-acetylglucosamine 2-epimerase (non-hydrolyzing) [Lactococcus nasutitermitis]
MKKKIMTIFGTRPEAIKMAPLIKAIEMEEEFDSIVVVTAQHRQMLDQVLDIFNIVPDYDLNIMKEGQSLSDITRWILEELDTILNEVKPDIVLVHGDTTTTIAASISAFYHQIKIGHVEAGLRTWNKNSPFPEEMNRQLTDVLADVYFAPTNKSKENLLAENHLAKHIFVTGNTSIDAMRYTISDTYSNSFLSTLDNKKIILVTMHRRENIGKPMQNVFRAINKLIEIHDDVEVVFPIHKNPHVRENAKNILLDSERIHIIEPLNVIDFQNFANKSYIIMTDSGGVQEEAPSLGVPVLVLRDTTERPEGVEAKTLKLVGTSENDVFLAVDELLKDKKRYEEMSKASNPYGDGYASERIIEALKSIL